MTYDMFDLSFGLVISYRWFSEHVMGPIMFMIDDII